MKMKMKMHRGIRINLDESGEPYLHNIIPSPFLPLLSASWRDKELRDKGVSLATLTTPMIRLFARSRHLSAEIVGS
jgi:hypothetical protein